MTTIVPTETKSDEAPKFAYPEKYPGGTNILFIQSESRDTKAHPTQYYLEAGLVDYPGFNVLRMDLSYLEQVPNRNVLLELLGNGHAIVLDIPVMDDLTYAYDELRLLTDLPFLIVKSSKYLRINKLIELAENDKIGNVYVRTLVGNNEQDYLSVQAVLDKLSSERAQVPVGNFVINLAQRTVLVEGQHLKSELTPTEYEVFLYLLHNSGRIITKEEIYEAFWTDSDAAVTNVTVTVNRIRGKLGKETTYIESAKGGGYVFHIRGKQK